MSRFQINDPPTLTQFLRLASEVVSVADGNEAEAERLLALITNHLGVSDTGDPNLRQLISRLEARGVVTRTTLGLRNPTPRYALSPEYRDSITAILEALQRTAVGHNLPEQTG